MRLASESTVLHSFIDRGYAGVALLFPDEPEQSIDWLNISKERWLHPVTGKRFRSSAPEMFAQASEEAADALSCLHEVLLGMKTPEELERKVRNDCLGASGDDGRIGIVRYSNPFPLDHVLEKEAQKRKKWLEEGSVDPLS